MSEQSARHAAGVRIGNPAPFGAFGSRRRELVSALQLKMFGILTVVPTLMVPTVVLGGFACFCSEVACPMRAACLWRLARPTAVGESPA